MLKRKYVIISFLALCLITTLFIGITTSGTNPVAASSLPYDPWYDLNDDGAINIVDIVSVGLRFGTSGTPINKTELLLELQSMVGYLNEVLETRVPKIGYISVPAPAFQAMYSPYEFSVDNELDHHENFTVLFYASVQLPHGTTVKNLTSYWFDAHEDPEGGPDVHCYLFRYNQTNVQPMAGTSSSGSPGHGSSYDDTINYATVDNDKYAYILQVDIPGESNGHGLYHYDYAVIEYEQPL